MAYETDKKRRVGFFYEKEKIKFVEDYCNSHYMSYTNFYKMCIDKEIARIKEQQEKENQN